MCARGRVLSVQSHVVSGYVGNKAAVFPLQLLGYDVDIINSVQFSNHTAYREKWTGSQLSGDDLLELVHGLKRNNLLHPITHLLTGYAGKTSFLRAILSVLAELRQSNSSLLYVCDPVIGDNGRFYVPEEMVQVYRDDFLPCADVLTPNCFELGVLTNGRCGWSEEEATKNPDVIMAACMQLHSLGVPTVIVTSAPCEEEGQVAAYASGSRGKERYKFLMDRVSETFTGSGDLTASLLLAQLSGDTGNKLQDLRSACEAAFATTAAIIQRTNQAPRGQGYTHFPELQLINSREDILHPPRHLVRSIDLGPVREA